MELEPRDILGSDGRLAQRMAGYELRSQQLEMADAVAQALRGERHLIVEAGTGTGKSLAYLVPAILAVTSGGAKARPLKAPPLTSDGECRGAPVVVLNV